MLESTKRRPETPPSLNETVDVEVNEDSVYACDVVGGPSESARECPCNFSAKTWMWFLAELGAIIAETVKFSPKSSNSM